MTDAQVQTASNSMNHEITIAQLNLENEKLKLQLFDLNKSIQEKNGMLADLQDTVSTLES